jgi:radical SAM protein with 4Fe4S-binding SPASM domain
MTNALNRDRYRAFIVPSEFSRYGIVPGVVKDISYLQVELTDRCNLSCASCPRAVTPSSNDILTVAQFCDILQKTPSIRQVSFVGSGEAFMLKDFADYVAACTERGIFSSLNTNGVLVNKRLAAAVAAGLGKIAISVDAADDLLVKIRSGLTRERLESSMLEAVATVAGTPTRLAAAVTLGTGNLHQFSRTLEFIAACGIREVTVESIHHWADDKSLNRDSLFHGDAKATISQIEAGLDVARNLNLAVEIFDFYRIGDPAMRKPMHCAWPWDSAFVTCKGDVTPCCINLEASPSNRMGRLSENTLNEIWVGERYTSLRKDMMSGRDWSFCQDCVYRMEFGEAGDG